MTYNSSNEEELIQLLIEVGVLTPKETVHIQLVKIDAILNLLLKKHILQQTDKENAKNLLTAVLGTNKMQRMHAKMAFIDLITSNLRNRVTRASKHIVNNKDCLFRPLITISE